MLCFQGFCLRWDVWSPGQSETTMTYDQLVDFVERRMRMSHIYQPVMLLTLLQHDGQCSETDIAKAISVHDPTQIEYYEAITRNMVGRVLTKHGVVKREGKHFSLLSARPLSKDQRAPASSGRMTRRTAHQWLKWVIGNREIIPAHCVIPSHLYLGYPSRTHTVAPGSTIDYKPIPPLAYHSRPGAATGGGRLCVLRRSICVHSPARAV